MDILLVEDNPSDADMVMRVMRRAGVPPDIVHAADGARALELLFDASRGAPRVVLLDLKLPKVDGIEVLRRIRADERTRTLPVVVLSSSAERSDLAQCYAAGVNSYVVKPTRFEDYARLLGDLQRYWLEINLAAR